MKHNINGILYDIPDKDAHDFLDFWRQCNNESEELRNSPSNLKALSYTVMLNDYAVENWSEYKV